MITKEELLKNGLFNSKKIVIEQDEDDDDNTYDTDNEDDEDDNTSNSGKVKLYKLDDSVVKILTDRLKDEYTAHYYYRAATNWCQDMNYKKAAEFFKNESNDELTHAEKIQEYMTGFNIIPVIPQSPTKHSFDSLIDVINGAYKMELDLMKSYNKNSQDLFSEDITTFDFLTELREIQKGAVVEYNDLINASELVNMKDKFQVLYFEQTYF